MPKRIDEAKIFDAALQMLASHGYEGATTRKIAAAAGVNEVTLFRRFGTKARLFEKAISHRLSDTPLTELEPTGDLETDLLAIVEAYLETNELHGNIVPLILIEAPRNPDLRAAFNTPWLNLQGILGIIREYQARGQLMAEAPLESLSALIGPVMVNQMFRRADLGWPVPAIDHEAHVAAFLRGRIGEGPVSNPVAG